MNSDGTETNLYVETHGQGEPVVLLHGGHTADPSAIWLRQHPLAARYRLIVPHRRGYARSPTMGAKRWQDDVEDLLTVVGEGAHLVALSYGAMVAMLFTEQHPSCTWSLTVIEPPTFTLALEDPAVASLLARLEPLYAERSSMTPEVFIARFAAAMGQEVGGPVELNDWQRKAISTSMNEPYPWTAPIAYERLREAAFPRLVVTGTWHPAFVAAGDALAARIGAERLAIPGAGHGAQAAGETFNAPVEALWQRARPFPNRP